MTARVRAALVGQAYARSAARSVAPSASFTGWGSDPAVLAVDPGRNEALRPVLHDPLADYETPRGSVRHRRCCPAFAWMWYGSRRGGDEAARNVRGSPPGAGYHGGGDRRRGAGGESAAGDAARVRRDRDGGRSAAGVSRHGGSLRARRMVDPPGAGAALRGRRPRARSCRVAMRAHADGSEHPRHLPRAGLALRDHLSIVGPPRPDREDAMLRT